MKIKSLFCTTLILLPVPLLITISCSNNLPTDVPKQDDNSSSQPADNDDTNKPTKPESKPTPDETNKPGLNLNPAGKIIDHGNLEVSAYGELIESLNLFTKTTYLPEISDQLLNEKLQQNPIYSHLKLKILANSNTAQGQLFLNLTSLQKADFSAQIEIKGFEIFTNPNNQIHLQYQGLKLNLKNWIETLKPVQNSNNLELIKTINSEQWLTFLNDFTLQKAGNMQNVLGRKTDLLKKHFTFEIKGDVKTDKTKINFRIITKFQNKKYLDNEWKNDSLVIWQQATTNFNVASVTLPEIDDVKQFLIDQTNLNLKTIQNHYPSYFLGYQNYFKKVNHEFLDIPDLIENKKLSNEDFKNSYFPNQALKIVIANDSISANDIENTLSLSAQLVIDGEKQNQQKNFNLIKQNKNLQESKVFQKNNLVQIKPDQNLFSKLIKVLKSEKSKVEDLFNQSNQQNHILLKKIQKAQIMTDAINNPITLDNEVDVIIQLWNKMNQQIIPAFFSNPINFYQEQTNELQGSNTLNPYTQWFEIEQGNPIVIEAWQFDFPEELTIELTKINEKTIKVSFEGSTEILLADSNTKSSPTSFWFNLSKEKWNNLKN